MESHDLESRLETLFNELLEQQEAKVLRLARERIPHLTADDILNPDDHPQLIADPLFNYEEGITAGIRACQFAVRSRILRRQ